ncbi:alpha/beta fold hydrolase [Pseudodesulfovibrio sp.]|uniref:alpha/beta fold hydrolase n=1 Tax=unclassified Pseudodesulfovibrio TaxID=2661612 RepID=UPI003B00AE46
MDCFEATETRGDDHVGGWITADDGARLWVDVHGTGRPLLLIHGWGAGATFWRRQIPLADHFQLIALDLRGHARSNAVSRDFTITRLAQDLHNILEGLSLNGVMLIGWSMGGAVILEYFRSFGADRLAAMGLVESCPFPFSSARWNIHRFRDNDDTAMEKDLRRLADNRQDYGKRFIDGMFLSCKAPLHALHWMLNQHMAADTKALTELYRDYVRRDYTPILPTITLPCLAVYGQTRRLRTANSPGRFVAGAIPGAHLISMEHSGHLPFYEEPELFNMELSSFLAALP